MNFPQDALMAREAADAAQPCLFSLEELPAEVEARMEKREQDSADWTAERLLKHEPRLYATIARMLAANVASCRAISFFCGVTERTVVAVREHSPQSVTAFRAYLGTRRRMAMARGLDVIDRGLEDGTNKSVQMARDAAVVVGILDQHDRLDGGAPTAIVRVESPAADEYRRFMEAIFVPGKEIGLEGDASAAKGGDQASGSEDPQLPTKP